MSDNNNTESALNAGIALAKIQRLEPDQDAAPVVILPEGHTAEILSLSAMEEWEGAPRRKTGTFHFTDVESFLGYFADHRQPNSRIFAAVQETIARFSAILNFHGEHPAFNDHVCDVTLIPTHEWSVWLHYNRKEMAQHAFALFLEENLDLFTAPSGASLLELITNLEGKSHVDITQAVKLRTGAINLKYTEQVELRGGVTGGQAGEMEVPSLLEVSIAPFQGTPFLPMKARLRFRIDNKKILFRYEAVNPHLIVPAVCADIIKRIQKETGTIPFNVPLNFP